ncbi:MAG: sugar transferase, partial [Planctomycetaceae bacterium]
MSLSATTPPASERVSIDDRGSLADLVDAYAALPDLPSTDWLTRLQLQQPRRDVRCLGERTRLLKRLIDVAVSAAMLLLLLPLMLLIALAVRLTSPGPAVFRQVRVGLNLRRRDRRRRAFDVFGPPLGRERRSNDRDRRGEFAYGRSFVLYK